MSEAKFTKGPWFIDKGSNIGNCITAVTGQWQYGDYHATVAMFQPAMPYGKRFTYDAEEESRMANAHLIAAAPEMYEMLDSAMCRLADEVDDEARRIVKEILALRKKARGEA